MGAKLLSVLTVSFLMLPQLTVTKAFAEGLPEILQKTTIELGDGSTPSIGVDRKGIQQTIICRPNEYSAEPVIMAKITTGPGKGGSQTYQVPKKVTMSLCLALRQEAVRQLVAKEKSLGEAFFQDWSADKNTPVLSDVTFSIFSSGNLAYDGEIEAVLIGDRLIFNQIKK